MPISATRPNLKIAKVNQSVGLQRRTGRLSRAAPQRYATLSLPLERLPSTAILQTMSRRRATSRVDREDRALPERLLSLVSARPDGRRKNESTVVKGSKRNIELLRAPPRLDSAAVDGVQPPVPPLPPPRPSSSADRRRRPYLRYQVTPLRDCERWHEGERGGREERRGEGRVSVAARRPKCHRPPARARSKGGPIENLLCASSSGAAACRSCGARLGVSSGQTEEGEGGRGWAPPNRDGPTGSQARRAPPTDRQRRQERA